jgi:hypothetical protein
VRFIKGFSNIKNPITSLQIKWLNFVWWSKCETKFQWLKHLLTNAPILKTSYLEKYFLVSIDACKEELGGVLMQEGHVISMSQGN